MLLSALSFCYSPCPRCRPLPPSPLLPQSIWLSLSLRLACAEFDCSSMSRRCQKLSEKQQNNWEGEKAAKEAQCQESEHFCVWGLQWGGESVGPPHKCSHLNWAWPSISRLEKRKQHHKGKRGKINSYTAKVLNMKGWIHGSTLSFQLVSSVSLSFPLDWSGRGNKRRLLSVFLCVEPHWSLMSCRCPALEALSSVSGSLWWWPFTGKWHRESSHIYTDIFAITYGYVNRPGPLHPPPLTGLQP